jgi:hypothetical protein
MPYLKDLSVSKVSFVHKAANKRRFLLLKSEDESDLNLNLNPQSKKEVEGYIPMRKELKDKLIEVIKSGKELDQIVDILKSDSTLSVTESEVVEISDYIDVVKMTAAEKKKNKLMEEDKKLDASGTPHTDKINDHDEDNKKKMEKQENDDKQVLLQKIDSLTATLEKLTKDGKRRDIVSWLQKECPFLMEDIQKTADDILELEAVSPSAAEKYKVGLQKASVTVENSKLFTEVGVSTDTLLKSESDGFELISKFNAGLQNLKKSASTNSISASDIVNLVKGFGDNYADYRVAHIRRAKRDAF